MLIVAETSLGTSEHTWLRSRAVVEAPEIDWGPAGRVVVVAPHPDDETLAAGGTLSMLERRGFAVDIVAITDGEGSHPKSPTHTPRELARLRAAEREQALDALGLDGATVLRLGIRDGHVADAPQLAVQLGARFVGAGLVLAPFAGDGHPDHDACGAAARIAAHAAGVPLFSYPVWAWHWATPESARLPWARFRRSTLDGRARAAKAAAIERYRSQVQPLSAHAGDERILPRAVLTRFGRAFETFIDESEALPEPPSDGPT